MGCFDTVRFICPACNTNQEVQTKAGDCALDTFKNTAVPIAIASNLCGTSMNCDSCSTKLNITALPVPQTVPIRFEVATDED